MPTSTSKNQKLFMELEKMQYSPLEKAQLSCMTLINVHMKSIMFCMSQRSEIRSFLNTGRGSMASQPLSRGRKCRSLFCEWFHHYDHHGQSPRYVRRTIRLGLRSPVRIRNKPTVTR